MHQHAAATLIEHATTLIELLAVRIREICINAPLPLPAILSSPQLFSSPLLCDIFMCSQLMEEIEFLCLTSVLQIDGGLIWSCSKE